MQFNWERVYNGSVGADAASAIITDEFGNSYVTGASEIANNRIESVTIKYNNLGDSIWTNHYQRSMNSGAIDIEIDFNRNIFVSCGAIIKYDELGNLIWSKYDSAAFYKIILDSSGNIYGGGTSLEKLTVGKYNKNGDRIWKKKYSFSGSAGVDRFGGFTKDKSGNLIITGRSKSNTTFYDYATLKYTNDGDLLWSRRYNGPSSTSFDDAEGVTTDIYGNIYVTGTSMDSLNHYNCTTIKYDSKGNVIWLKRIPADNFIADIGYNISTDSSQNVFIAGRLSGRTSIIKLDIDGNVLWYRVYSEGSLITDNYPVIVLDSIYNIYTTGISTATGGADYAAIKYDSSGNQIYVVTYNNSNTGYEYVYDLALGRQGDIYLTGEFSANGRSYGTVKFSPIITGILENEIKTYNYKLEQNYPNPFNPSTHLEFGIPESGFVSLKIFDVLGNEVSTLVNENKPAGRYEVTFNASNARQGSDLPSGIYFYSLLIDGNTMDTKRMILLK
jgi:hypothetical protein